MVTLRQLIDAGFDLDAPLFYEDSINWYPIMNYRSAEPDDADGYAGLNSDGEGYDDFPLPMNAVILE